jgi:phenylpyruvate tautomerase PptA (4-oxalocrotonate tautomerase family)
MEPDSRLHACLKTGLIVTHHQSEAAPMSMISHSELPGSADGLSRRDVMVTATVAAVALAGAPSALAAGVAAEAFGAPLVELHIPAGVLTPEQKSDMVKGITDVLVSAIRLPSDQTGKLWVQIFETAESGWGVGGQIFVPRNK